MVTKTSVTGPYLLKLALVFQAQGAEVERVVRLNVVQVLQHECRHCDEEHCDIADRHQFIDFEHDCG
jgi:hypothetical protein